MMATRLPVASARGGWHPDAEDVLVRSLAAEILATDSERASIERELARRLSGDETYRCLLTVPAAAGEEHAEACQ